MNLTRSLLSTADETIELSQVPAMGELCQLSQISINGVTGTVKLLPLARQTLDLENR